MNLNEWRSQAIARLQKEYTDMKTDRAAKWVDQYISATQEIFTEARRIQNSDQRSANLYPIDLHRYRQMIDRKRHNGKTVKLSRLLDLHHIQVVGSNTSKQRSIATTMLDKKHITLLGNTAQDTYESVYNRYTPEQMATAELVPVCEFSLANYIERTTQALTRSRGRAVRERLFDNIETAQCIQHIAEYTGGYLPHIPRESDYGRKYYLSNLNLQSVHRQVRTGVLGDCWSVDINSAVFAFKRNAVRDCGLDINTSYTLELLDQKQYHRKRLARLVFGHLTNYNEEASIRSIKQAITAVGFGAIAYKERNAMGKSLSDIFVSNDTYSRFINDEFIRNFIAEQREINRAVVEAVKPQIAQVLEQKRDLFYNGRGINRGRVMAYLYQHTERHLLEQVYQMLEPGQLLLHIHDGFYARNLTQEQRLNIKHYLDSEGYSCSIEQQSGYMPDYTQSRADDLAHQQQIAQEEQAAQGYVSQFSDNNQIVVQRMLAAADGYTGDDYTHDGSDSGGCWAGSGYTGSGYDSHNDPYLADNPDYLWQRQRSMPTQQDPTVARLLLSLIHI